MTTRIQGISSLYQRDSTITNAKKQWDEINDPWLQGFVVRSYDSKKAKAWKIFKSIASFGLAPYIALIHDLIVFDRSTLNKKVQTTFQNIKGNINDDLERMDIQTSESHLTLETLTRKVYKRFEGSKKETALFLRTVGQGPISRLKNHYEELNEVVLSTNEDAYSKIYVDIAKKTILVVGYFIKVDPPTKDNPEPKRSYMTLNATFDFKQDHVEYSVTPGLPYDPEMNAKVLDVC